MTLIKRGLRIFWSAIISPPYITNNAIKDQEMLRLYVAFQIKKQKKLNWLDQPQVSKEALLMNLYIDWNLHI